MIEIKPLRYFLSVADCLSFTRAAEQLHIAQPAISMAIKKLETEFGVTLFHRYERKISLTDEGHVLYEHARRLVKMADDTQLAMNELHDLTSGEVRVGIPSMLGSYYFPPILMAFKQAYPRLTLRVIEGGTWRLQQMLEAGDIDLSVIVAETPSEQLESHALIREQMMVTVSQDHKFARQSHVTPEEFFEQELVMFKEGYFHRKVIDRLAEQQQLSPNISFETNLIPLIKSIVEKGFGISTLLDMVIDDQDALVTRPFSDPIWLDINIAWRKNSYLSKANVTFLEFLMTQAQRN